MEVLICEVNNAASRRWVQAGRTAPRSSGPSSASTKEDATRLGFRGGDGGDGGDDGGGGA